MSLVPYTATALSRNDITDTPKDKNVVSGAIVEVKDSLGALVVIYDDEIGTNPETQKTCDTDGQLTFYVEAGDYILEIDGKAQFITTGAKVKSVKENLEAIKSLLKAQGLSGDFGFFADGFTYVNAGDVGIDTDDKIYTYVGASALPVAVTAGTSPAGDGDYKVIELNSAANIKLADGSNVESFSEALIDVTLYKVSHTPSGFSEKVLDAAGGVVNCLSDIEIELDDLVRPFNINNANLSHDGVSQAIRPSGKFVMVDTKITSNFHAVQANSILDDTFLIHNDIDAERYGLLFNTGVNGSSNTKILFSKIRSNVADAIEYNSVGGLSKELMIVGNSLSGGINGTSNLSGFSVGMAETNSTVTALNISEGARARGYHSEACDNGNIVIGNLFLENDFDGAFLQPVQEGHVQVSGVQVISNYFSGKGVGSGVNFTYRTTGEGSFKYSQTINNQVVNFDNGVIAPFKETSLINGNVIKDCNTGIIASESKVVGKNLTFNVDTLLRASRFTSFDGVHSETEPTDILAPTSSSSRCGASVKNFSLYRDYTHGGASTTEWFSLFNSGRVFKGEVTVRIDNNNNFFFTTAYLIWDGTTLTVENQLKHTAGNVFGTINFRVDSNSLEVSIGSASSIPSCRCLIEFEGVYYRHTL